MLMRLTYITGRARTSIIAFEGESIKLIDQYVDRKLIILLGVFTFRQEAPGICYTRTFFIREFVWVQNEDFHCVN